jgi:FkbM family methyltransferase
MHKAIWRISYLIQKGKESLTGTVPDWSIVLYFIMPGSWRTSLFSSTYIAQRFLTKHNLGTCTYHHNNIELHVGDLQFTIPRTGFEQGDVFDILVPYLLIIHPEKAEEIRKWMRLNTDSFYDGPYLNEYTHLTSGDTVIDTGASVGLFSVIASKLVGETGKIYAVEPIEEVRIYLTHNLERNACSNVTILPYALGEHDGIVSFDINLGPHFEGSSKYISRGGAKRSIPQKTLDTLKQELSLERIHFIKADIEGSERDLIAGATDTFRQDHPLLALRTYHLPDDQEVLSRQLDTIGEYDYVIEKGTTLYAWHHER